MNTRRFLLCLALFLGISRLTPLLAEEQHVVFLMAEDEYRAADTLPVFARTILAGERNLRTHFLNEAPDNKYRVPGMEILAKADLLVLYVRRRSLPPEDMAHLRNYLAAGKPLLALRTSSHAWDTRNKGPKDQAEWPDFDPIVLGGNYHGHHGRGTVTATQVVPGMGAHPIFSGWDPSSLVGKGSLYKAAPLAPKAQVLLIGTIPNQAPEPILWLHQYGQSKVLYTSLGHIGDFAQPGFNELLLRSVRFLLAD